MKELTDSEKEAIVHSFRLILHDRYFKNGLDLPELFSWLKEYEEICEKLDLNFENVMNKHYEISSTD